MKLPVAGACVALLLQAMLSSPLPQQPASKGSIEGVVTRAGTGDPVPGAVVSLTGGTALSPTSTLPLPGQSANSVGVLPVTADGQGRFAFRDLNPGLYRVSVRANGYAKREYGQQSTGAQGKVVSVGQGQTIRDLGIPLIPAGNISGRIRDNFGQPAVGIQVQLLMATYNADGQRSFQSGGVARTDDRGEYRLFWITPGRYYLVASTVAYPVMGVVIGSPNESSGDGILPTYYPGTAGIAQATVIDVKPGAEIGGVDVVVNRQASYRIRGRVIDSRNGQVPPGVNVTLVTPAATGTSYSQTNFSQSYNAQDGTFELRDVSPGPHILRAQSLAISTTVTPATSGAISSVTAGMASFNVTSDMDGVVLTMANPVAITGRLSLEGSMPSGSPGLNSYRVQLRPSMDGVLATNVGGPTPLSQSSSQDGAFRVDNVLPGEYRLSVTPLPPDVYVKQARFNQADVLNKPMQFSVSETGTMDIVLSNRGGQIDGIVSDEKQHAASGIQAVLIPERVRDRVDLYKTATTDSTGRFSIRGITPGDYRIFAWEALDPFAYFDPDLLKQYEQKGRPVHIAESSKETVDVRMIPAEQ